MQTAGSSKQFKKFNRPILVEVGQPDISDGFVGAWVWLDAGGAWHLQWRNSESVPVWFRLSSDDSVEVIGMNSD